MDKYKKQSRIPLIITLIIVSVMGVLSQSENSPISAAFSAAARGLFSLSVQAARQDSPSYEELQSENKALKSENAALRSQLTDFLETKSENVRLMKFYGLKKKNPSYKIKPAKVISRDPSDDFGSFTLDVGKAEGVRQNDAVVTENGLVGRVARADSCTCLVRTILSPDTKVGAAELKSGETGIVSGTAELSTDSLALMKGLKRNCGIRKGDLIVTSGMGGFYPPDLIIGRVTEIRFNAFEASDCAVIEPLDDIERLDSAAVITDFDGKGEVSEKNGD